MRVNPLVLSVTVDAFAVPDAEGRPVAAFRRLYVRFDPLGSLARRAWTLGELRLESPAITLEIRPDRTLNLVHLLRPGPAPADTSARPPGVLVRRLSVLDGALSFADRTREPALRRSLRPIPTPRGACRPWQRPMCRCRSSRLRPPPSRSHPTRATARVARCSSAWPISPGADRRITRKRKIRAR